MAEQRTGAILLRVSSKKQAEEGQGTYSVQLKDCQTYAATHGIIVPGDLIWQEVGQRDQYYTRDGLQAALEAAKANRYQALIVWRLDRLTDDIGNFLKIMDLLQDHGALPWSATEPDVDLSTPNGLWYVHTKLHFQVQPERKTTALRTQRNRREYTERGRPWASQRPRYGYKWVVDPTRTAKRWGIDVPLKERLEPDPATAPVVVRIYEWADQGKTTKWIARALSGLEEQGIYKTPTPRQHSKMAGASANGRWEDGVVRTMLTFPGYMGKWPAYRTKHEKRTDGSERSIQRPLPEEEWLWVEPSPAPALVSPALWHRVQKRLTANKLYSKRNRRDETGGPERALLFSGMARCQCGSALDVYPKAYQRADGVTRWAYRCRRHHRHAEDCPVGGIWQDAESLDWGVWEALLNVLRRPDALRRYAQEQWLQDHPAEAGVKVITPADEQRDAERRLAECDAKVAKLMDQAEDPSSDPENKPFYDQRLTLLREQRKTIVVEVARAAQQADAYQRIEQTIGDWETYLDFAHGKWDFFSGVTFATNSDAPHIQRKWLENLGARVIVGRDGATLQLHLTRIGPARPGTPEGADAIAVPVVPAEPPKSRPSNVPPQRDASLLIPAVLHGGLPSHLGMRDRPDEYWIRFAQDRDQEATQRGTAPNELPDEWWVQEVAKLEASLQSQAGMSYNLGTTAEGDPPHSRALVKRNDAPQISARAKSTAHSRTRAK